jgi:hypothetical protein
MKWKEVIPEIAKLSSSAHTPLSNQVVTAAVMPYAKAANHERRAANTALIAQTGLPAAAARKKPRAAAGKWLRRSQNR